MRNPLQLQSYEEATIDNGVIIAVIQDTGKNDSIDCLLKPMC